MPRRKTITYPLVLSCPAGKVKVYKNSSRGVPEFVVSYVSSEGRKRNKFREEEAAILRAEELIDDLRNAATLRSEIDSKDALEITQLRALLAPHKATLSEAVHDFLAHKHSAVASAKLAADVVEEYLATFEKPEDDAHLKTARSILRKFGRSFGKNMAQISVRELDQYLRGVSTSGRTRNNHLNYLRTFFLWAQKYGGYLPQGPLKIQDIKKYPVKAVDPSNAIMKPEDLEKLLQAADADIVPSIVIGAFAGVRNAEIGRLRWEDINMNDGVIVLSPSITKTQRRRMAVMPANLIAWLESYAGEKAGPIVPFPKGIFKKRARAAKAAGISVSENSLRKSYISYKMAECRNAAEVAEQCGNSVEMVQVNYKGLVTEAAAKNWFSILPAQGRFELLSKAA